ncbi:glutamate--cysteine ligase [Parendozoicomonas haliclonae]|uniref:Glutamate--cysteine ligase n=1 Tax=Parendozoicomonas haliclonae TaxID=1960125 RepID=A0A1X7ARH3_9GAMM|nr:glutamate--cysteine ligase [Parendozoicomonas haliclonae]SMA50699.1 Glutamate-cysteine ligase [Parendozoicomonas haliclonae]
MSHIFTRRLSALSRLPASHTSLFHHGLEKEALRVNPELALSQTPHPPALGAALTHPSITVDYSEAMLEFVTGVHATPEQTLAELAELHMVAQSSLSEGELLWPTSMPAVLHGDEQVPVAQFGNSNAGQFKHIYRLGLGHRYGRAMQTIAGIHYNLSLDDQFWQALQQADQSQTLSLQAFKDQGYFSLIRNYRRYAWLISYLLGASPAMDKSFFNGKEPAGLQSLDKHTLYLPWATSLRMSDLGYTSSAQASLPMPYNALDTYISTLRQATSTPYLPYQSIGIQQDGSYRQLNSHLLQIENEFYSIIRPKRVMQSGEKPTDALEARGVEYLEVRNLDINPLLPLGMDTEQAYFLDTFLIYCLLQGSPALTDSEYQQTLHNFALSVKEGRRPGLMLIDGDQSRSLQDWGQALLKAMQPVADWLDSLHGHNRFSGSLVQQKNNLTNPELTPSAQILKKLQQGQSFRDFSASQARDFTQHHLAQPLAIERQALYARLAEQSHQQQATIEASDTQDFASYLHNYFASPLLEPAA